MKKNALLIIVCLVSITVFSLAGCSNIKNSKLLYASQYDKFAKEKIAVAGIVYLEDQFMKLLSMGYEDAASMAGISCQTNNINNDYFKEAALINTLTTQGINGIAIAPLNEESSIAALKDAAERGVKITLMDCAIENTDFIIGGFKSDQFQLGSSTGEVAAKFIKDKLDGKAKIAIIQFESLLPEKSTALVKGFLSRIEVIPGAEIITYQDAWEQDKAVMVVSEILTANPDIDIIFAANDGGTVGAAMAVKNAGKSGEVYVFGIDTSEQIAGMLQDHDNILQAVTGQDPYSIGSSAMTMLIDSIQGKDAGTETGKILTVNGVLLNRADQEGIETFLVNLRERTKE